MASYYLESAAGTKILKQFDPDVINAVQRSSGLQIPDLVLRGTNEEGDYLYGSEDGWILDNLTDRELAALRAYSRGWRLYLGDE